MNINSDTAITVLIFVKPLKDQVSHVEDNETSLLNLVTLTNLAKKP